MDRRGILAFLVLLGALAFWVGASSARASDAASGAACMPDHLVSPAAREGWMNEQIAEGRGNFVPVADGIRSVGMCAW